MKIDVGSGVMLDLEALIESRLLVQAQSGGGKTTLLRRILEQSHGKVQQIVIDPEGEFYTLREKFDYVIAGKGGDCAADPRSAKLLARRLLELGVSAVCDLYELKAHDRIRFVRAFLEALVEAPRELRHPVLVVVDEAHIFCPEKGQAESAAAVIDICARGRKRGLCPLLATQRLSKLHKDAAAELRNVLIGATGLDIDQQRAGDVLGFSKADRLKLRDLKWREFYAYGPALSPGVIRLTVGETQTQNPKQGHGIAAPAAPTAKIRALLAKVADLPAEAEQEARDMESLRRELAETRRKLTLAEKAQRVETVVQPCGHEVELARMHDALVNRDEIIDALEHRLDIMSQRIKFAAQALSEADGQIGALERRLPELPKRATPAPNVQRNAAPPAVTRAEPPARHLPAPRPPKTSNSAAPAEGLSGPQQRILDVLTELEMIGVTAPARTIVAALVGYHARTKAFINALGTLRTSGYVDYPGDGALQLTDEGRTRAAPATLPLSLAELHERVKRQLSGPQRRIIDELIAAWPDAIDRAELAARVDYHERTKAFINGLGKMRSMGIIDYTRGGVVATPLLFPEGLA